MDFININFFPILFFLGWNIFTTKQYSSTIYHNSFLFNKLKKATTIEKDLAYGEKAMIYDKTLLNNENSAIRFIPNKTNIWNRFQENKWTNHDVKEKCKLTFTPNMGLVDNNNSIFYKNKFSKTFLFKKNLIKESKTRFINKKMINENHKFLTTLVDSSSFLYEGYKNSKKTFRPPPFRSPPYKKNLNNSNNFMMHNRFIATLTSPYFYLNAKLNTIKKKYKQNSRFVKTYTQSQALLRKSFVSPFKPTFWKPKTNKQWIIFLKKNYNNGFLFRTPIQNIPSLNNFKTSLSFAKALQSNTHRLQRRKMHLSNILFPISFSYKSSFFSKKNPIIDDNNSSIDKFHYLRMKIKLENSKKSKKKKYISEFDISFRKKIFIIHAKIKEDYLKKVYTQAYIKTKANREAHKKTKTMRKNRIKTKVKIMVKLILKAQTRLKSRAKAQAKAKAKAKIKQLTKKMSKTEAKHDYSLLLAKQSKNKFNVFFLKKTWFFQYLMFNKNYFNDAIKKSSMFDKNNDNPKIYGGSCYSDNMDYLPFPQFYKQNLPFQSSIDLPLNNARKNTINRPLPYNRPLLYKENSSYTPIDDNYKSNQTSNPNIIVKNQNLNVFVDNLKKQEKKKKKKKFVYLPYYKNYHQFFKNNYNNQLFKHNEHIPRRQFKYTMNPEYDIGMYSLAHKLASVKFRYFSHKNHYPCKYNDIIRYSFKNLSLSSLYKQHDNENQQLKQNLAFKNKEKKKNYFLYFEPNKAKDYSIVNEHSDFYLPEKTWNINHDKYNNLLSLVCGNIFPSINNTINTKIHKKHWKKHKNRNLFKNTTYTTNSSIPNHQNNSNMLFIKKPCILFSSCRNLSFFSIFTKTFKHTQYAIVTAKDTKQRNFEKKEFERELDYQLEKRYIKKYKIKKKKRFSYKWPKNANTYFPSLKIINNAKHNFQPTHRRSFQRRDLNSNIAKNGSWFSNQAGRALEKQSVKAAWSNMQRGFSYVKAAWSNMRSVVGRKNFFPGIDHRINTLIVQERKYKKKNIHTAMTMESSFQYLNNTNFCYSMNQYKFNNAPQLFSVFPIDTKSLNLKKKKTDNLLYQKRRLFKKFKRTTKMRKKDFFFKQKKLWTIFPTLFRPLTYNLATLNFPRFSYLNNDKKFTTIQKVIHPLFSFSMKSSNNNNHQTKQSKLPCISISPLIGLNSNQWGGTELFSQNKNYYSTNKKNLLQKMHFTFKNTRMKNLNINNYNKSLFSSLSSSLSSLWTYSLDILIRRYVDMNYKKQPLVYNKIYPIFLKDNNKKNIKIKHRRKIFPVYNYKTKTIEKNNNVYNIRTMHGPRLKAQKESLSLVSYLKNTNHNLYQNLCASNIYEFYSCIWILLIKAVFLYYFYFYLKKFLLFLGTDYIRNLFQIFVTIKFIEGNILNIIKTFEDSNNELNQNNITIKVNNELKTVKRIA